MQSINLLVLAARALDYTKDPDPNHWRTINGSKVHLDENGNYDGGAGGKFNGKHHWGGPDWKQKNTETSNLAKALARLAKKRGIQPSKKDILEADLTKLNKDELRKFGSQLYKELTDTIKGRKKMNKEDIAKRVHDLSIKMEEVMRKIELVTLDEKNSDELKAIFQKNKKRMTWMEQRVSDIFDNLKPGEKLDSNEEYRKLAKERDDLRAIQAKIKELYPKKSQEEQEEWRKKRKASENSDNKIANVSKGEPMDYKTADSGSVNPVSKYNNYKTSEAYHKNCQTCVPVFEARLRGYKVVAKGNTSGSYSEKLSRQTNLIWIDPETGKHPEYIRDTSANTPKRFYKMLDKLVKPGQRYSIEFGWRENVNYGHIINLDRDEDGNLRFKDNQRPNDERSEWIGEKQLVYYLEGVKFTRTYHGTKYYAGPKLLRLDNMDFDYDFASKIMEEEE